MTIKRFKKDDIIVSDRAPNVQRLIVKVYKNHYLWKCLSIDEIFSSANSQDSLLVFWEIKGQNKDFQERTLYIKKQRSKFRQ